MNYHSRTTEQKNRENGSHRGTLEVQCFHRLVSWGPSAQALGDQAGQRERKVDAEEERSVRRTST